MVKLFSKNSNLCDHNSPTSRTDGRTDRQTTCDSNTALCTKVHRAVKMVNGSLYYRAFESFSIASALSSALAIYPCQIRVINADTKLQLPTARTKEWCGWPQRTVYPRRLPVNTVVHTTLAGLEPTTIRLLVRHATNNAIDSVYVNGVLSSLGLLEVRM